MIKQVFSLVVDNEDLLHNFVQKGQIINFKHFVTYEHFKNLMTQIGQDARLNEVRLAMSHEYFNKLNFIMYQLYCEILFKQVKHATIFAQITDSDGNGKPLFCEPLIIVKKADFVSTLQKYSIVSPSQIEILLQFYDPLKTDMVFCTAFIEHMTNREFVNTATQVTVKNDLIPYFYQKVLEKTERQRLGKIHESFKEALKQLT